jgi:maltose 6'-phosphate phosphatase
MKILSLNLHCFAEDDILRNQDIISDFIIDKDIDVVFLQEVAQSESSKDSKLNIKSDNYGYVLMNKIRDKGIEYDFHYMYGNLAFGIYQEGLAILSKTKLFDKEHFFISKKVDYNDWHTRVIVSCKTLLDNKEITLTSAHLGWTEGEEIFEDQIDRLVSGIKHSGISLLAGDFNVASNSEQYKYILSKGYQDVYHNNEMEHFYTPTHVADMDVHDGKNRIDYIFSNTSFKLVDRKIVFTDTLVSDHYGVYVEIELGGE